MLIFLDVSLSFVLTLQSAGTTTTIILDSILLPHSLCQALRWYSGDVLKSRAKIRREGREGERWGREKWEREPVSISLTTLFRPFLSRLDSTVKTVNTSVSYNHSQSFSRAHFARRELLQCECVEILCRRIRYPMRASGFFGSSF